MARVPRALQAAALPKRCSTLEPTPRRIGFELGTYWRAEPGTKGVLPYGHFDQGYRRVINHYGDSHIFIFCVICPRTVLILSMY
jgi:hypothetical protein